MLSKKRPAEESRPADIATESAAPGAGKGRATPTRKEAEAQRKRELKPPLTRKEAAQREREARAKARAAMLEGDERALLPRDQGPVKRAVRDYVDGRRNAGELFLPGALVILVLGFIRDVTIQQLSLLVWLAMVLAIVVDSFLMIRRMKRDLADRFPNDDLKGVTFYAVMRALQIRRLRVPKVQARPGDNKRRQA